MQVIIITTSLQYRNHKGFILRQVGISETPPTPTHAQTYSSANLNYLEARDEQEKHVCVSSELIVQKPRYERDDGVFGGTGMTIRDPFVSAATQDTQNHLIRLWQKPLL